MQKGKTRSSFLCLCSDCWSPFLSSFFYYPFAGLTIFFLITITILIKNRFNNMNISYAYSIQHTTYIYLLIPKPSTNFFGFLSRCPFFLLSPFCLEAVRKGLLFLVAVVVVILMGLRMNDRSTQMHNPSTPQRKKEEYYVKCVLIYLHNIL